MKNNASTTPLETFLALQELRPTPAITRDEAAAFDGLTLEIKHWHESGAGFHPSQREATKRALRHRMLEATNPEKMIEIRRELLSFDSVAEDTHRACMRGCDRACHEATTLAVPLIERELAKFAAYRAQVAALDLSPFKLSTAMFLSELDAFIKPLTDDLERARAVVRGDHRPNLAPVDLLGHLVIAGVEPAATPSPATPEPLTPAADVNVGTDDEFPAPDALSAAGEAADAASVPTPNQAA